MRGDLSELLVVLIVWLAIIAFGLYIGREAARSETRLERDAKNHAQRQNNAISTELLTTKAALETATVQRSKALEDANAMATILKETASFYPSLAEAAADFHLLAAEKDADFLARKSRPAIVAADKVRDAARARRDTERELRQLKYQLLTYEGALPWITEFAGRSTKDILQEWKARRDGTYEKDAHNEEDREPERNWLSDEEFRTLSTAERADRALSRWRESRRANAWEAGRDYERFVGYMLELDGHDVEYWGATMGLEDMGRDLVATKGKSVRIVQCKRWSTEKVIHEKHIFQLVGTALEYACFRSGASMKGIDLHRLGITPVLATTTVCSEKARKAAQLLGVELMERFENAAYPVVKCNVSGRTGEKIYHLPFDQQYDRIKIHKSKGEFFAASAAEAEEKQFRRAHRYRGGA